MYRKAEKELPDGWALNKYGNPSTDAEDVLKNIVAKAGGGIMPLGGSTEKLGSHKGYGYGMLVELLSSIASMGITSNHTHMNGKGGTCHGFIGSPGSRARERERRAGRRQDRHRDEADGRPPRHGLHFLFRRH